ncbi:MAG: HAMP domain-containing histidine kinase, partial [Myxococcales bacterium]|nr:HAMP domain-containing histidine kinase [Myxococcales bacterium]
RSWAIRYYRGHGGATMGVKEAKPMGANSVVEALRSLSEELTQEELSTGLEEFLSNEVSLGQSGLGRLLVDGMSHQANIEILRQTMHELRSLLAAVRSNTEVAQDLLEEVLSALAPQPNLDIQLLVFLREAVEDAVDVSRCAVDVATDGIALHRGGRENGVVLRDAVHLVVRSLLRGPFRNTPIHVGTIPPQPVRPPMHQIVQVLTNLVRNAQHAVEAVPEGAIDIDGWASSTMAFLRVSDNGPGIQAESVDRLFNLFHTTKKEGHGIGLFVSREIVHRWGSDLQYEPGEHGGATFTFGIPII